MEQVSLKAGAAGDLVIETGSLEAAARSVGSARDGVARAAATVRECLPPPDTESAGQLAAMLIALDEVRNAERFDDWVQAWVRAMEHRDAFTEAFAIAQGAERANRPAAAPTSRNPSRSEGISPSTIAASKAILSAIFNHRTQRSKSCSCTRAVESRLPRCQRNLA